MSRANADQRLARPRHQCDGDREESLHPALPVTGSGAGHVLKFYGPTARAFNAADAAGRDGLRNDIAAVFKRYDEATDGTCATGCEYLQVIATRR